MTYLFNKDGERTVYAAGDVIYHHPKTETMVVARAGYWLHFSNGIDIMSSGNHQRSYRAPIAEILETIQCATLLKAVPIPNNAEPSSILFGYRAYALQST